MARVDAIATSAQESWAGGQWLWSGLFGGSVQLLYFAEKSPMASGTILDDEKEKELMHASDTKEGSLGWSMCGNV